MEGNDLPLLIPKLLHARAQNASVLQGDALLVRKVRLPVLRGKVRDPAPGAKLLQAQIPCNGQDPGQGFAPGSVTGGSLSEGTIAVVEYNLCVLGVLPNRKGDAKY